MSVGSRGPLARTYRYRWVILAFGTLAYATSHLTRWNYTSITKFLQQDLGIEKGEIGLLGAAFFYPYALSQVPWGALTDRIGGRAVISGGVIGAAALLALFALSGTFGHALGVRFFLGVFSAAAYVPIASLLARWFTMRERALATSTYAGLGGGVGELLAFLAVPWLAITLFRGGDLFGLSEWRGATIALALLVLVIGVLCALVLRSFPSSLGLTDLDEIERERSAKKETAPRAPGESGWARIVRDPGLWLLAALFSGGIIAIRLVPGWLPTYAADIYMIKRGLGLEGAVLAGGVMGMVYVLGRVIGIPIMGALSDRLRRRGIGRIEIMTGSMVVSAALFWLLSLEPSSPILLGALAFAIGIAINLFPLVAAAVAEIWVPERTGLTLGVINTVAQVAGATSLAVSGYLGISLAKGSANPLSEYEGIWWLGIAACLVAAACGLIFIKIRGRH